MRHSSARHGALRLGASVADNVELHLSRRLDFEEGVQPDFEIAHGHDAVDDSRAEFPGESEDVRGDARRWRFCKTTACGRAWAWLLLQCR